jgi:hypothetical protein
MLVSDQQDGAHRRPNPICGGCRSSHSRRSHQGFALALVTGAAIMPIRVWDL